MRRGSGGEVVLDDGQPKPVVGDDVVEVEQAAAARREE
jgi:hypothetical protein